MLLGDQKQEYQITPRGIVNGCHLNSFVHVSSQNSCLNPSLFFDHLCPFLNLKSQVCSFSYSTKQGNHRQNKAMMQFRLATASSRSYLAVFAAQKQGQFRRFTSGAAIKGRTADPTIHSGELEAGPDVHRGEPQVSKIFSFLFYFILFCFVLCIDLLKVATFFLRCRVKKIIQMTVERKSPNPVPKWIR